jgi:hypothetical protein
MKRSREARKALIPILRAVAPKPSPKYLAAAGPILAEIRAAGFDVNFIAQLYYEDHPYVPLMPRLLEWLPLVKDETVKDELARAITDKAMRPAAAPLIFSEFAKAPKGSLLQWILGNALSVVADDSVFDQIAAIARDRNAGNGRPRILDALANMKRSEHRAEAVRIAVDCLAEDDLWIQGSALRLLQRFRAKESRPTVEHYLEQRRGQMEKHMVKEYEKTLDKLA